ncbi:LacI family DNA-binding transcriptional regulator [Lacunisphaera limnophila]|nr:LacI family DNA-binding transcriptional regulator [Lacunisphaera limnophila]
MVTQKDVARDTGLSQTAVSLALRNSPEVSTSTIRLVRAAAKRLHYRPDPMISALMAQRHRRHKSTFRAKIAFLTAFPQRNEWRESAYSAGCFAGARQAALDRGYVCEPVWLREPGVTAQRMSGILWTQNVQGLLFAPLPVDYPSLEIEWGKFSALSLDYSLARPVLSRVVDDHAFGIERVLEEIGRRNYRRPGLVLRASQDVRTHHSRLGVFLVQHRLRPEWEEVAPLILPEDRWDERLFAEWVRRERPDVVLTEEDRLPAFARTLGLRVPRDLGIAFFYKDHPTRTLSGLQINSDAVGATAANILIRMIETNERGAPTTPTTTLVQSFTWNDGRTLRRPTRS